MIKKKDFLRRLSAESGFTQKDIEAVLGDLRTVLIDIAKEHESVRVFDGLVMEGKVVPPRTGRNPATGESIEIPEKLKMNFKEGTALKAELND